jgi:hypothetical protein
MERWIAGTSLGLSGITLGVAPNFGRFARFIGDMANAGTRRGVQAMSRVADAVSDGSARIVREASTAGTALRRTGRELTADARVFGRAYWQSAHVLGVVPQDPLLAGVRAVQSRRALGSAADEVTGLGNVLGTTSNAPNRLIGPKNAGGRFGGVVGSTAAERSFLDNARATFGEGSVFNRATRHRDNIVIQRSDIPISIENLTRMKSGNAPFAKNAAGDWESLALHHVGRQDGKLIEIFKGHNAYDSITGGILHIPGPGGPVRQSRLSRTYWQQRLDELIGSGQVPDAMLKQIGR